MHSRRALLYDSRLAEYDLRKNKSFMSNMLQELTWRGFIHQATHDSLSDWLETGPKTLYCGFDPTADSLHIGSLLPIIGLMHFQRAGHKPIAVVGGATGMIGDPSGKTAERQLLDAVALDANVAGIEKQLRQFISFEGDNAAIVVNNYDWLGAYSLVDFLRDIGKHFSVNVMMGRESVRARLEDRDHGISYTEFSYQLLQACDFLHLYDAHDCRLQIGGSDQWGNIVAGMDLTRRIREGAETYGLTFPLVTKADGSKFGKSESGNIWIDPARTSPYRFYQYWINQADADAPRFLRLFTFLSQEEIVALDKATEEEPHRREAQRTLAEEVTKLVHGEDALEGAIRASKALFGGDLNGLDEATLEDVFSEAPSSEIAAGDLSGDKALLDVLVEQGVFASKGEGRRMIQNGGLYMNNERIGDADASLTSAMLTTENLAVVRKGKKNYHLLRVKG